MGTTNMDNMPAQRDHSPMFLARDVGAVAAAIIAKPPDPSFICSLAVGASVADLLVEVPIGEGVTVEVTTEGVTEV